ncbi:AAA family ATPase [Acinetobacter sp.]|uniref:AAA family ATPase n=1 Tax=Acinetobacter sp. TaxID=472 RepID=UPI00388D9455
MTHFLHQPAGIFLRSETELLSVGKELPIGTYMVSQTPQGEFYLTKVENFTRPKKTYGSVQKKANRIMAAFGSRPNSTGVLLSGEQGSGKTMLARELSLMGADQGMSTIIVNSPFCGANFNHFIQMIDVPAVVIFDEFEKLYDNDDQEKMLTLLDGLFPSKKLFVLTANNLWRIDTHMINRPGRIFYHLKYEGLEAEFIREYCEDVLINQNNLKGVEHISIHFHTFNFDMLKALVEEMNRFDMTAMEAVEMLNVTPIDNKDHDHDIQLLIDGVVIENLYPSEFTGNPLSEDVSFAWRPAENGDVAKLKIDGAKRKTDDRAYFSFGPNDLMNISKGTYTYTKGNTVVKLIRHVDKKFNYLAV